jgi:hypothetical protein
VLNLKYPTLCSTIEVATVNFDPSTVNCENVTEVKEVGLIATR